MGIDQWEWEGMGILIVFPHTSTAWHDSTPSTLCYVSSGMATTRSSSRVLCKVWSL